MDEKEKIQLEIEGDSHMMTGIETPMSENAFELNDAEKIEIIQGHFNEIMKTLGLNLNDDSLNGTPYRVAKMYVNELFSGLNPNSKPSISVFDNKYKYNKLLVEKNITFSSSCEHHFLPIVGKAHIGYISSGKVIGLSKLNRIVDYYAKRPQVQERATIQIFNELKAALSTEDIIVVIDAEHLCVSTRGIKDRSSSTITMEHGGKFNEIQQRNEFLKFIDSQ